MGSDFLRRQHEEQRFRHAIDYVADATRGAKALTTSELARLNRIITAGDDTAWRFDPAEISIPTGKVKKFSVISNPIEDARRILGHAKDMVSNGEIEEAAVYVYLQLVEEHLFLEANRRTAALALQWILNENDREVDTLEVLNIQLGDVREKSEREHLRAQLLKLFR